MKIQAVLMSFSVLSSALFLTSCSGPSDSAKQASQTAAAPASRDKLTPAEFNALAVRLNLPLYWTGDTNGNKSTDDDEIARLLFYPGSAPDLDAAYKQMLAVEAEPPLDTSTAEGKRRSLVRQDLAQGRPALVRTDFTQRSAAEKAFVQHMLKVAASIDDTYAAQKGLPALSAKVTSDPESQSLFRRNWGPKCLAPATQKNPDCSAIPGAPQPIVDSWPATLGKTPQTDSGFCALIEKQPNVEDPFTAIHDVNGKLTAVPYSEAYKTSMTATAMELNAAADALNGANEEPLIAYLRAAANGFTTNNWWPADEAWARMNAQNSKWYVRAGPDEVYWDPCSIKAGFHLTLALINQGAKEWQEKLTSIQQDMETAIAQRAGAPYKVRQVKFHLPDFIDIVVNAGDDRSPLSGTIGESLPNFGPVAKESRGRTVAMVNIFNDPDTLASRRRSATTLIAADSMSEYSDDPLASQLSTVLHEATHNLGPAQEYAVRGTPIQKMFGGPIDSMLEELKAQTGGLFYVEMLRSKGMITDVLARQIYLSNVVWALGQSAKGMYTASHERQPYPQLAAIQLGILTEAGALTWDANATAANGQDKGAYMIHLDKMVATADAMMRTVAGIKGRGDKKGIEELIRKYVDGSTVVPHAAIEERWAREPRVSLVYSLAM
jgi:hypothetical protein